jgi:hypothetical protein
MGIKKKLVLVLCPSPEDKGGVGNYYNVLTQVAYVFSKKDIKKLFSDFSELKMKVAHFPLRKYNITRWIPLFIEKFIAFKLGWHLIIYAKK